jgi:hypothetical protein
MGNVHTYYFNSKGTYCITGSEGMLTKMHTMNYDELLQQINKLISKSGKERPKFGHEMRKYFQFDERYINLNHGR